MLAKILYFCPVAVIVKCKLSFWVQGYELEERQSYKLPAGFEFNASVKFNLSVAAAKSRISFSISVDGTVKTHLSPVSINEPWSIFPKLSADVLLSHIPVNL